VRVPAGDYHFVARTLDAGAMGVMVPMVESAAQAKAIVDACRYPPKGKRGAAFGMAHDDYAPAPVRETMAKADARTLVICLIETAAGIENVDAIADVEGVDVLWLGHFDLTNSMGIPAEFDHPRFVAAVDKVVAAARRTGKTAGFMAADEAWGKRFLDLGFRLIAYGLDSALLQGALSSGVRTLRAYNGPDRP
jgi:2-keto-3-deoxy-L-rhamnonate aldolase RhmA